MSHFTTIQNKLEQFIRRYYTNELLKGAILFFSIGLLYFLFTLFIEYVLWLNTTARTVLFWVFILVELALFVKFIVIPLMRLFKLQKGIDYKDAATIIGNHFPEVNDKLLNVLQLRSDAQQSELLLASIEQKSTELSPVPFKLAINFNKNAKYLKYAAIPIAIILISVITGKINWFSDSYTRVVNFKTAYEPPAPFQFFVVNEDLQAIENKDFKLQVKTAGDVFPENAKINFNGESYFLNHNGLGDFEFVFKQPKKDVQFHFTSGAVTSKPYELTVTSVPSILDFEMVLDYPSYTKRTDEILKSTGNANVPQGTQITWKLKTKTTDAVSIYGTDTLSLERTGSGYFEGTKQVFDKFPYDISTSNASLKDYEHLSFNINVIKDEFPELKLQMALDSTDQKTLYFKGQASDDYGLSKLQLVYYPVSNEFDKQVVAIPIESTNITDFISVFPNQLELEEGVNYELYFQVFDNDAINHFKGTKSKVYTYRKSTKLEEEAEQLNQQNETIQDLDKSLEKFDERQKELEELSRTQKEKSELNFNEKRQLENFLKRQKQQEEMMQNYNEKLTDNLEKFKQDQESDDFKEDLKERLKDNEKQLKEDEKLLEELQKLQDKINKEELSEKLEQLAKQNKNQKRSLEQLLELTKRYYINKKMEKLQGELNELADEQLEQSNKDEEENKKSDQDSLNKKFEDFQKEMDALEKENEKLIEPMKLPNNEKMEDDIKKDQEEASDELEKQEENSNQGKKQESQQNNQNASKKQKQAGQKMKQMSQQMQQSMMMMGGGGEQMQEDIEMLRKILDNLILFSFDQENLMDLFKDIQPNHNKYADYLKRQYALKEHFSHIDDSLFALSLRQPKISEFVNQQIYDVFFNIDKSMDHFSDNRIYQGVSNQQYTITSANNLADFLSNLLNNMQMQMNAQGQGQGSGKGQQGQKPEEGLPDIIMSQEELNKQAQEGLQKVQGQKGKEAGEQKGQGEKGEGQDGQSGGENGDGQNGDQKQSNNGMDSESQNELLFQIYQQQSQIRQELENRLKEAGINPNGNSLLKQMENVEMDLLNKGLTEQTVEQMKRFEHQLLKMENATFKQGKENKRESETNDKQYQNTSQDKIPTAKEYFNTDEILNRQALPLQPVYNKKVKEYFKQTND
ncbi:DUF4175 family protein [Mangrovimonas sp. ST2L15]|uniref:DUF4175 family protein n=1 Tax=Mangrovimonas sp. ST2L15 TaxID=1645916 RepID=UPI0006B51A38|nr:DUF4175 family protein [Mangrovimonas sp. ST2L15]